MRVRGYPGSIRRRVQTWAKSVREGLAWLNRTRRRRVDTSTRAASLKSFRRMVPAVA